jgi:hypothetical protein
MSLDELKKKIITPMTRDYREGISPRFDILDSLTGADRIEIENFLIDLLVNSSHDDWVIESLAHMKPEKAIEHMHDLAAKEKKSIWRIHYYSAIYYIKADESIVKKVIEEFGSKNIF